MTPEVVFFAGSKYGLDENINWMGFECVEDRDEFVERLASAISDLGLCWIPETSSVIGPADLELGMSNEQFSDWFNDQSSRLWDEYSNYEWGSEKEDNVNTYYIAKPEYNDDIYGGERPVCLSLSVVEKLARGWRIRTGELLEQMDKASAEQIAEYGTKEE